MTRGNENKDLAHGPGKAEGGRVRDPEWTASLKQLYDSVLDEPIPDSFKDLLSRLDDKESK